MMDCRVFIVLATCEGETYLPQLLTSIRTQSHADWTLLARDDQSGDATSRLLREASAVDSRIEVIEDDARRLARSAISAACCKRRGAAARITFFWPIKTTFGTTIKSRGSSTPCARLMRQAARTCHGLPFAMRQ